MIQYYNSDEEEEDNDKDGSNNRRTLNSGKAIISCRKAIISWIKIDKWTKLNMQTLIDALIIIFHVSENFQSS